MKKTDVLVIGAGPAGSMCGYLLQKAGIPNIVIDYATFPRDKVCGGGLTPKCWKLLDELMPGLKYDYNPVRKIRLVIEKGGTCEFEAEKEIRLLRRKVFDNILLNTYIESGGQFQKGSFQRYEEKNGEVIVTLKSGEQIACRYLIGADGSNSAIRHQLKGSRDKGILVMEQYVEKSPENIIEINIYKKYDFGGYYYRFPNNEFDIIGYGDISMTPDRFREILKDKKIPETHMRGCYIYQENDYPLNDHIILIGDAGGFANRFSREGIKYAFITAQNAVEAINSGHPFKEVNAKIFRKMKVQYRVLKIFYIPIILWLVGKLCKWPSIVKKIYDKGMRLK